MNLWRPVDAIGEWILNRLGGRGQLRLGVLLLLVSILFYPYLLWTNEPPVIYFLSVSAMTGAGLGFIVGAAAVVHLEAQNQDVDVSMTD